MSESISQEKTDARLHISPEVARYFAKDVPKALQLKVAKGTASFSGANLVHSLFLCWLQGDDELKEVAMATLRASSNNALRPVIESSAEHPRILDFIARVRIDDLGTLVLMRRNPVVLNETWIYIFGHCNYEILTHFCDASFTRSFPDKIRAAVLENRQAPDDLKALIKAELSGDVDYSSLQDAADDEFEPLADTDGEAEEDVDSEYADTQTLSKQKIALELGTAEKVKMAMTGDKEWRNILIKESNKMVSSAVLKNPRITEGEILFLVQNRSSSEDIIREILLNRDWVKNYSIRHALIQHPRTPLPQAIRFLNTMNEKDIRMLAKSRNVSSAIVNNCRRMIAAKDQRH
ncbi:MAG: hypothetical protein RBR22_07200 [Desulfuromonas sp.]|nr:hypothetical protein [Desulfuromonas sp.]